MLRALETAQIIADLTRHEIVEDARLGEIAFGDFEGHTLADVEELLAAGLPPMASRLPALSRTGRRVALGCSDSDAGRLE